MIEAALVSGSLRKALYRDVQGLWVLSEEALDPTPAGMNDLAAFRHLARELSYGDEAGLPISLDGLRTRLEEEITFVTGVDGLLVGMDPDFSDPIRSSAIRAADGALASSADLRKRIRSRVLVPTNSEDWEPLSALRLAEANGAEAASEAYRPLAEGLVDKIVNALNAAVQNVVGSGVDAARAREGILRSGLLAELCELSRDRPALLALPFQKDTFLDARAADPGGKIITLLVKQLADSIPAASRLVVVEGRSQPDLNSVKPELMDPLASAAMRAAEMRAHRRRRGYPLQSHDLNAIQREISWIDERLERGEVARAEGALLRLIEDQASRSEPRHIVKTLTAVADRARRLKQHDFALKLLDAADFLDARDSAAMCVRGELLRELGRTDEALEMFRETMERFPHAVVAPNAYAETLRELGRTDEALAVLRETMERFPHDEVAPTAYAGTLREVGRTDEALAVFRNTMERFPHNAVTPNAYAETLRELGRADEALAVLGETMERFAQDEVTPNAYAGTLREVGRIDEALAVFRDTMERFPQNAVAPNAYAETLRDVGRTDEALAVFHETMERFPYDEVAPNAYAETLRELGRTDEALAVFRETMERFPHNHVAPNAYAETLRELGRTDEALAVFRETMERFPHNVVTRNAYAETLRELGRTDEALAVFREAIELFPHDEVAPTAYAETLREVGRTDEALTVFRETMERFPDSSVVRTARADLLIAVGDFSAGEKLLASAAKRLQRRDDWISLHVLAMGHLRRGEAHVATELLLRGRECPFADVVPYFRTALAVAYIMNREAKRAVAELEIDHHGSPSPRQITNLLVRAHALGECGEADITTAEITRLKNERALTEKQLKLAEILLFKFTPARALSVKEVANDNIFRLEIDLLRMAA
jgi:predicted Zn-dependent protease